MKLKLLLAALSAAITLIPHAATAADTSGKAADSAKPLVVVNGVPLPQVFANFIRQGRINRNSSPEALTDESIRDAVVTAELMSQEAIRKGLDKGPTLLAAIDFQKKEILSQALIEDFVRSHPISEETVKTEYERAKNIAGETEFRPSHILLSGEKEAKTIIAKLAASRKIKFEDLAKKESKDSSAGNGGDLGWVLPANLVPEFAKALMAMKKGETSKTPVQTKFGWHVIRLDDTRKLDFPEYDKLKNRIASQMQQQQLRKYVQELRAGAKIE